MATSVKMPQLGMTMTEAKIVRWLKREGEPVSKGEPVAEIETDKLNAEVDASANGVIRRIVAAEGEVVPVIGIMAVIGGADEPEAAIDAAAGASPPAAATSARPPATVSAAAVSSGSEAETRQRGSVAATADIKASPIAKRLAADLGVDLSTIEGTGPGGRIVEADVRAAGEAGPLGAATRPALPTAPAEANGFIRASPIARRLAREHDLELHAIHGTGPEGRVVERDVVVAIEAAARERAAAAPRPAVAGAGLTPRETIRLEGMRRLIAERMHQSLVSSAQLTLTTEADATALVEMRGHLIPAAKVYGHRPPTYTDLIVQIVARTLRAHPLLNSSLTGTAEAQEIVCWQEINIGVAVALERGLLVPVIRNADQKPLQTISQELGDLAERARANRLSMDELQGGTFTITNMGQVEVDAFTPILNPPQSAILGLGRIAKKPAVHEDQVKVRQMVTLSLTFDHRIVDGTPAGAFLRDVKRGIEAASLAD
jgi:pyruvate dehydrogenase E2 component (dihydrolipoamide acetyltransferase)